MQRVARVDSGSALNGGDREVAYTRLERLLAHLEALTGLLPACAAKHAAMYDAREAGVNAAHLAALAPSVKRAKTEESPAGNGGCARARRMAPCWRAHPGLEVANSSE